MNLIELPMKKFKSKIDFDVVLLGLNWYREKDPRTPMGLALIAAFAKEHLQFSEGNHLQIINSDVRSNLSTILHQILEVNPRILGIGVYVWNIVQIQQIIFALRKLGYSGKIVLGGPEITYGDESLKREFPDADYFVKGDGEKAFTEIIKYEANYLNNLSQGIFRQTSTDFVGFAKVEYSEIVSPFLNTEYLIDLIGISEYGFTRWQTQRGCLYRCSFCAFPNGYKSFKEQDLELVEKELNVFKEKAVKEVAVLDPIFFVNKERARAILLLIDRICPEIRFEIQTKLEHLDEELLRIISQLNIFLECGVQTLDPIVQQEIRRLNHKDKMINILSLLSIYEIEFEVHLIYGLPKQTLRSLRNDYNILSKYTSEIKLFPLILLKGTGLDIHIKNSVSEDFTFSPIFSREIISTKWIDSQTIMRIKQHDCELFQYRSLSV